MSIKRFFGLSSATALFLAPCVAQAQSCSDLKGQFYAAHTELGSIALDYPKTHLAIVACIYGNDTQSDRQSCVSTVIFGACLGLGPDGCSDLTTRWARVGLKYYSLISQMTAIGCRP